MITSFFPKRKRAHPANDSSSSKRPASAGSVATVSTVSTASSSSASISAACATSNASVAALLSQFPSSSTEDDVSWGTALKKTLESKQFENLAKFVEKERCVHYDIHNLYHHCHIDLYRTEPSDVFNVYLSL
jgi:3-oxoacyl-ACP reductase-like protein